VYIEIDRQIQRWMQRERVIYLEVYRAGTHPEPACRIHRGGRVYI